ncbi:hypothetical protein OAL09_01275 [Verrucomicrobia bacterium]|jgi:hypothetical protein|nr:hypothetical protein [Verrucomicrobiales bacterium]MDC0047955.1 hypothetical protein [Verrucomicrobiota bacterium]NCG27541.1 hypothetical protein [Verrucomicrobiales bacterium]|tara:strand:- start:2675 stop:3229 length:555 start_codon:yes stop_codon:yes gene_type:complete
MKKSLSKQILVFLLSFGSLAVFSIAAETKYDCSEVAKQTKAAVSAKPGAAASTVRKMISKYENCVCSIVKAAIAGGGDVKDVVTAAVKAAPKQTAVVHECAVAASPKSSKAISAAIDAVMGGGDDFGTEPVVVSGVYLIAPVASAGGGSGFFGPLTAAELAAQQALIDRLLGRDTDTPSTPTDP